MTVVHKLSERNLDGIVSRTPYLLVRVDRLPGGSLQKGLAEYFEHRFPRLFTFATLARTEFGPHRLEEMFQSSVGKLRAGVQDGYYLFEGGLVVAHHVGQARSSGVSYGNPAEESAQRERILGTPGAGRLSAQEIESLRQLVAYLEPIVERKQRAAGFNADGTVSSGQPPPTTWVYDEPGPARAPSASSTGTPAPAQGGSMGPDDPYVVLGITAAATDDEVKTAYRNQLKLNHPDKVAHLSPALQAFAQQQTLAVNRAYESILSMRGQRR
jgi:DnaJ-domain-containing protein 1